MTNYVHLRAHTRFSVGKGAMDVATLVDASAAMNVPAATLSDVHGIYGAVEFSQRARIAGLKPIIAADLLVQDRPLGSPPPGSVGTLLLVAITAKGLANLARLSSLAWTAGWTGNGPRVDLALLSEFSDGLVVIAGGPDSLTGQRLAGRRRGVPAERILQLLDIFGPDRLFLEVQRGDDDDLPANRAVVILARKLGVRPVATADCRFTSMMGAGWQMETNCADPFTGRCHEVRCLDRHLLAGQDLMTARFAALPSALANTLHIADMVEDTASPSPSPVELPQYPLPCGGGSQSHLVELATNGLSGLLNGRRLSPDVTAERYQQRLQDELAQIAEAGCADAFLVHGDIANAARELRIATGPGWGASGSSLVLRAIGVTAIDPVAHGLVFERLLRPGSGRPPWLAIDVAWNRREEIVEHLASRFGEDRLAFLNRRFASPFDRGEMADDGAHSVDGPRTLKKRAPARSRGAAGIAICSGPALAQLPLMRDQAGDTVCQYGPDEVEDVGVWAVHVFGFKPLAQISAALGAINQDRPPADPIRAEDMQLDDPRIYSGLTLGPVPGIFQLAGRRMGRLASAWQVDCLVDLIALTAVFRPQTLEEGLGDDYADRKHGRTPAAPPHPVLADLLADSHGLVLYQEQVIAIVERLTGCSRAEAAEHRRRLGKGMIRRRGDDLGELVELAVVNGFGRFGLRDAFNTVQHAATMAFTKAHAVHMATVTARTLWLRRFYPLQWALACLDKSDHDGRNFGIVLDAQRNGVEVHGPDLNHSGFNNQIVDGGLRLGLGNLRGLAKGAAEAVAAERARGPYGSIAELAARLPEAHATLRTLDVLACGGALDGVVDAPGEPVLRRTMAVKQARACAADLLGLRVADLAGPERWGRERVVTEEQRAMGGVTVSGWRLIGQQEQGQQARAAAMSKRQVLRRWRRR